MTGFLFAFVDLTDLPGAFYFGLRIVVAVLAGVVGWYLTGPVARALHRLAFQKPISKKGLFGSRLVGAVLLALLAFIFIPIGPGWGWGPGGGGGGSGKKGGSGQNTGSNGTKPGTGGNGTGTSKGSGKDKLFIEIAPLGKPYGEGNHYLIHKQEPGKSLDEVEKVLKETRGKWSLMEIIVYANSIPAKDVPVQNLQKLAEKYELNTLIPKEYSKIEKAIKNPNP